MNRELLERVEDHLSDCALWADESSRNMLLNSIKSELAKPKHSLLEDYEHFCSYSGIKPTPITLSAFYAAGSYPESELEEAKEVLKDEFAKPEPKPVAVVQKSPMYSVEWLDLDVMFTLKGGEYLYTAPPVLDEGVEL